MVVLEGLESGWWFGILRVPVEKGPRQILGECLLDAAPSQQKVCWSAFFWGKRNQLTESPRYLTIYFKVL